MLDLGVKHLARPDAHGPSVNHRFRVMVVQRPWISWRNLNMRDYIRQRGHCQTIDSSARRIVRRSRRIALRRRNRSLSSRLAE